MFLSLYLKKKWYYQKICIQNKQRRRNFRSCHGNWKSALLNCCCVGMGLWKCTLFVLTLD